MLDLCHSLHGVIDGCNTADIGSGKSVEEFWFFVSLRSDDVNRLHVSGCGTGHQVEVLGSSSSAFNHIDDRGSIFSNWFDDSPCGGCDPKSVDCVSCSDPLLIRSGVLADTHFSGIICKDVTAMLTAGPSF
jgi:hypothetical protein